jgi:hypothetical protein
MCLCQLLFVISICYLFICARLFVIVIHLFCSLIDYLLFIVVSFSSILCFVVQEKKNNSDPELEFRYFDPANHHQYKSINIIQQTPPTLS